MLPTSHSNFSHHSLCLFASLFPHSKANGDFHFPFQNSSRKTIRILLSLSWGLWVQAYLDCFCQSRVNNLEWVHCQPQKRFYSKESQEIWSKLIFKRNYCWWEEDRLKEKTVRRLELRTHWHLVKALCKLNIICHISELVMMKKKL